MWYPMEAMSDAYEFESSSIGFFKPAPLPTERLLPALAPVTEVAETNLPKEDLCRDETRCDGDGIWSWSGGC